MIYLLLVAWNGLMKCSIRFKVSWFFRLLCEPLCISVDWTTASAAKYFLSKVFQNSQNAKSQLRRLDNNFERTTPTLKTRVKTASLKWFKGFYKFSKGTLAFPYFSMLILPWLMKNRISSSKITTSIHLPSNILQCWNLYQLYYHPTMFQIDHLEY